jgi:Ner family transcriptional regulator
MSQLDSKTRRLFRDPIKRRAWVKYQIHCQGRSMAQVAKDADVDRRTLYQTFLRPYPRMEKIIAKAVGLEPRDLFPERYDADGLPCRRMGRRKKSTAKTANSSSRRDAGNVKAKEAA